MGLLVKKYMGMGQDEPVFVDWIMPAVGQPRLQIDFEPRYVNYSFYFAWQDAVPTSNTVFGHISKSGGTTSISFFGENRQFKIWDNLRSRGGGVNKTIAQYTKYNIAFAINSTNLNYWLGVDDVWGAGLERQLSDSFSISSRAKYKLWITYLTDFDTKVRFKELHPCFYRGEYGLWDVLTNTFYGNTVEGASFTGGND